MAPLGDGSEAPSPGVTATSRDAKHGHGVRRPPPRRGTGGLRRAASSLARLDAVLAQKALEVVGVEDHAAAHAVEGHRPLPDELADREHGDAQERRRLLYR